MNRRSTPGAEQSPQWGWSALGAVFAVLLAWVLGAAPSATILRAPAQGSALTVVNTSDRSTVPGREEVAWVRLADGTWTVLGWDRCTPVTVRWNAGALGLGDRAALASDVQAALAMTAAASGLTFRVLGTTTGIPQRDLTGGSADIMIAVVDPDQTDLPIETQGIGYTQTKSWVWPATNQAPAGAIISRAGIVLDRAALVSLPSGVRPGQSRGNVILHELGHAVGLRHSQRPDTLMGAELRPDAAAGWTPADREALAVAGGSACRTPPAGTVPPLG